MGAKTKSRLFSATNALGSFLCAKCVLLKAVAGDNFAKNYGCFLLALFASSLHLAVSPKFHSFAVLQNYYYYYYCQCDVISIIVIVIVIVNAIIIIIYHNICLIKRNYVHSLCLASRII